MPYSDDTPPEGAVCVEDGCTLDAVTTRPVTQDWLTEIGVVAMGESAQEWVCSIHAPD